MWAMGYKGVNCISDRRHKKIDIKFNWRHNFAFSWPLWGFCHHLLWPVTSPILDPLWHVTDELIELVQYIDGHIDKLLPMWWCRLCRAEEDKQQLDKVFSSMAIAGHTIQSTVPFQLIHPSHITGPVVLNEFGHLSCITSPLTEDFWWIQKTVKKGFFRNIYRSVYQPTSLMGCRHLNLNPIHCIARNPWSCIVGWLFFGISHDPSSPVRNELSGIQCHRVVSSELMSHQSNRQRSISSEKWEWLENF